MTLTLELEPGIEARLRENAALRGLTVEEYLLTLAETDCEDTEPLPRNPADAVAYWEQMGVHDTAPGGPDSPELGRQWREQLWSRALQGGATSES